MILKPTPFNAVASQAVGAPAPQASITTLQIDGITITKDIAKQLDELRFVDHQTFTPLCRVRTGLDYGNEGIELLGTDTVSGALVRMWHATNPLWTPHWEDFKFLPPTGDGLQDVRDALTQAYSRLPLIVLPKDGRP